MLLNIENEESSDFTFKITANKTLEKIPSWGPEYAIEFEIYFETLPTDHLEYRHIINFSRLGKHLAKNIPSVSIGNLNGKNYFNVLNAVFGNTSVTDIRPIGVSKHTVLEGEK